MNRYRKTNLKIKSYSKMMPSMKEYIKSEHLDNDNCAVIYVNIDDGFELFNKLSVKNQLTLNDEIFNYIESKAKHISIEYEVKINFIGKFNDDNKEIIKELVKENYYLDFQEKKREYKFLKLKTIGLTIFGLIILSLYFRIKYINSRAIFSEILSIVGTFSLWEAANSYLVESRYLKSDIRKIGRMAISEIIFSKKVEW